MHKHITHDLKRDKYRVQLRINGIPMNFGDWDTIEDALQMRAMALSDLGRPLPADDPGTEVTDATMQIYGDRFMDKVMDRQAAEPASDEKQRRKRRTDYEIELDAKIAELQDKHDDLARRHHELLTAFEDYTAKQAGLK